MSDSAFREMIVAAVREAIEERQAAEAAVQGDKLALREANAAELLDIPAHSLRDLRRKGLINGIKLGGRIVYSRQSLIELLERQRVEVSR